MDVPYMQILNQPAYNSPSSHYEDDDVMSRSSYNVPVSNESDSTVTFDHIAPGRNLVPRCRVRDMVKLFEGPTINAASTPVHRADSSVFTSPKPYYNGAAPGNTMNSFGDSQASVKQYATQFQEGDEQVKANRCNSVAVGSGARGDHGPKQYVPQYQESEDQTKVSAKCRGCIAAGSEVAVAGYGASQSNLKQPYMQQQYQDGSAPVIITDRCPRCNEVHYCSAKKKARSAPRSELECNTGSNKPSNGPYTGFAENRNSDMLRSSSKECSQFKLREPQRTTTNIYEKIDSIPVSLAYASKTTIHRTADGVRIVVDISADSMSSISVADMMCSRIETEMPPSRILAEFQQKTAVFMTGEGNRL